MRHELPIVEISPLRRRLIEDMPVRNLSPETRQSYIRAVLNDAGMGVACIHTELAAQTLRTLRLEESLRQSGPNELNNIR